MLRRPFLALLGLCLSHGIALAQAARPAHGMAYSIGFSTYLSHVDRCGAAFDIVSDSKGFIYLSGNTRDRNFYEGTIE